ncbi:MAG: LacI family DNA-binding transcriptional regulator [Capsulimonadaceae bacterium]|nr:LacI family DNA-binding transcriptional regulator [Capsulimonadaceae bacterium]
MGALLKDVARRTGLAPSTVSKILNEVAAFSVPEATRERVLLAASELGYSPNRMARGLGRGRTDNIGLLISSLHHPFFADIAHTLDALAAQSGRALVIEEDRPSTAPPGVRESPRWPVDGMIAWVGAKRLIGDERRPFPVVYVGEQRTDDTDWVSFDLYGGGQALAMHVLAAGRRKPMMLAGGRDARMKGVRDAMAAHGIELLTPSISGFRESRQCGFEAALRIADLPAAERPDVILCHNDVLATGVYHALLRRGVRVPEDIAVTGFDGIDEGQWLDKKLTTLRFDIPSMCASALDILVRRMAGDGFPRRSVIVPGALSAGETA